MTETLTASVVSGPVTGFTRRSTDIMNLITVTDMADGNWEFGVQYDMDSCGEVGSYNGVCMPNGETKDFDGLKVGEASPFVVHAAVECGPWSRDREERAAIARLNAHEGTEVEKRLIDVYTHGQHSQVDTTEHEPPAALAKLEDLIEQYGWEGIIQAPAAIGAVLAQKGLLFRENGRTVTYAGTPIAFGHGYTKRMRIEVGSGGTGVTPTATQGWMWVSGQIELLRSPVRIVEAFDRGRNAQRLIAERMYVPKIDCLMGGVLVKGI